MEFSSELKERSLKISNIINELMPPIEGEQKLIFEAMDYVVKAGGKRIRPVLMMESFNMFSRNPKNKEIMEPILNSFILALEMIHTFSLCHDDLPCMDNDKYRRGKNSCWYEFGEDIGTLTGDALSLYAFEAVSSKAIKLISSYRGDCEKKLLYTEKILKAINILSEKSGVYGMLGGQLVDVAMTGKELSQEQISFIYRLKTGALIESALMIGAVLSDANNDEIDLMETLGRNIGVSFQIRDDILDKIGTDEELGKATGSDENINKFTYLSLNGMENSEREVRRCSKDGIKILRNLKDANKENCDFLVAFIESLIYRMN